MKKLLFILFVVVMATAASVNAAIEGTYVDAIPGTFGNTIGIGAPSGGTDWAGTPAPSKWYIQTGRGQEGPEVYQGQPNQGAYYDLVITIDSLTAGTAYDVSVIHIGHKDSSANWGVHAGFSLDAILGPFYYGDGVSVDTGKVLVNTDHKQLQSPIGSTVADANGEIDVYIQDGGLTTADRSWWDGVAYSLAKIQIEGSPVAAEGGASGTFDVSLGSAPTADVAVALNYDSSQLSLSDSVLTFTTSDWDTPQTVTATAVDDSILEGDSGESVGLAASSTDTNFDGYATGTTVLVLDNEAVGQIGDYVDANLANTEDAFGDPNWYTSGPWGGNVWLIDGKWRWREGDAWSNENNVFEISNDPIPDTDPQEYDNRLIKTTISGLTTGTEYEVRAVHWNRDNYDQNDVTSSYNIRPGLTNVEDDLEVYSCTHNFPLITGDSILVYSLHAFTGDTGPVDEVLETQILLGSAVADANGEIAAYITGFDLGGTAITWYEGLTYQKKMIDVVETDDDTAVGDGDTDTFTVALSENADGSDVVVSLVEIGMRDEVSISPETLTFSSGSYTTPQTVTITGLADAVDEVVDIYNTTVVLTAASSDAAFDGYKTTVVVNDADCGAWGLEPFDFNQNCTVDLPDLAIFAMDWLDCTEPFQAGCTDNRPWKE